MSTPPANPSAYFDAPKADASDHSGLSGLASEIKDAGQSLWKEAYEHPFITAGVVAVGALALYAERGKVSELLPGLRKQVLLVEDTPYMGRALKSALEQNGERVTWVTGVKSANPFRATTIDGKDLVLDPRKFKIAFVDGELKGSYLQGEHVVDALHRDGVTSIGTSSVEKINDVMRANGAEVAAQKSTIVSALANNQIDLAGAVRAPGRLQEQLSTLTTSLKGPGGRPLRQKADELLTKFINAEPDL